MPPRNVAVAAALFCIALGVIHTWPLASDPAGLSRTDNADSVLNAWIIAWVAHQLPRDPLNLYEANIFYPEPRTLAFSEPLFVPALLVAPVAWAGGSAILTFNLALIAGMTLTALAGFLLAFRITRDPVAAAIAASLVAFNAHTLTTIPHIQLQHAYGILLALLGLDLLIAEPRRRRGALLIGSSVLALTLTSGYMTVLGLAALGTVVVLRAPELLRRRSLAALRRLAVAAVVTALATSVLMAPYWMAHVEQGMTRVPTTPPRQVAASYLASGARVHFAAWSHRFGDVSRAYMFPGVLPLGLAALAVFGNRGRFLRRRQRSLVGVAAVGVFLSFGGSNPVYMFLYGILPPLQGLRIVARFGLLMLFAVGVLAGCGFVRLRRRYGRRGWFPAFAALLVVAINVEVLRAPRPWVPFDGIPPIYDTVAAVPAAVLVEFPFYPANIANGNASYMLASTRHWRPLLNGYSGFVPQSYRRRAVSLAGFPGGSTIVELRAAGVTHIVVHTARWPPGRRVVNELLRRPSVVLVQQDQQGRHLFAMR